jgi:hypothetical protein
MVFDTVPIEIFDMIVENLDIFDATNLKSTSRWFRERIDISDMKTKFYLVAGCGLRGEPKNWPIGNIYPKKNETLLEFIERIKKERDFGSLDKFDKFYCFSDDTLVLCFNDETLIEGEIVHALFREVKFQNANCMVRMPYRITAYEAKYENCSVCPGFVRAYNFTYTECVFNDQEWFLYIPNRFVNDYKQTRLDFIDCDFNISSFGQGMYLFEIYIRYYNKACNLDNDKIHDLFVYQRLDTLILINCANITKLPVMYSAHFKEIMETAEDSEDFYDMNTNLVQFMSVDADFPVRFIVRMPQTVDYVGDEDWEILTFDATD